MARHSGLQKQVLALYRKILRVAVDKDRAVLAAAGSSTTHQRLFVAARRDATSSTAYACREFRRQAHQVQRNDFKRIEYMMRKGEKHLKLLRMPGVQTIGEPVGQEP